MIDTSDRDEGWTADRSIRYYRSRQIANPILMPGHLARSFWIFEPSVDANITIHPPNRTDNN